MSEGFYRRGSTTHRLGILCTGMAVIWKQRMLELCAVFNFFSVRAEHICPLRRCAACAARMADDERLQCSFCLMCAEKNTASVPSLFLSGPLI